MTALATPSPKQQAAYHFQPMSAHDLPAVNAWLAAPHVREWWSDEEITLAGEDEPALEQYIVVAGVQPFAYLQCYLQRAYPENGLGTHPPGTRGIDLFIGAPGMLDRGHGSAFIETFVERLAIGAVPRVIADPNPGNTRAIRAFAKAGFLSDRRVHTPEGPALLMIRDVT
jgi:aminoglycoside 6'-N-acetyltransferase